MNDTAGTVDGSEQSLAAALRPFGWTCTEDFWRRYYTDPWVFNLANAVERLTRERSAAALRTVPPEHLPNCPLSGTRCTSWTCLIDVCADEQSPRDVS